MTDPAERDLVPDTRFEFIDRSFEPVLWPDSQARFGLIALDSDLASERELRRLLPAGCDELFVTRVRHGGQCDLQHLAAMGDELGRAASVLLPGTELDAIAYGCTSGTVAIGFDRVREAIQSAKPGTPVTTPISAARAAFRALGVDRIAMLTPYIEEVNRLLVDHLATEGVHVNTLASFGVHTDTEISSIPADAIMEAARAQDVGDARALFVCCTGLRVAGIIDALERETGLPVVTSNQAMAWEMLRRAGCDEAAPGTGRLMELPLPRAAG